MKKPPAVGPYGAHIDLILREDQVTISRITSGFRFAVELRSAARLMVHKARAVAEEESDQLRAFVTAAVILAYSYLEATLNEFILRNATSNESPLSEAEKAIIDFIASEDLRPRDRTITLQLFNMMLRILQKPQLAESEEPYQAANAVRLLRNRLVHPQPGWVTTFSDDPSEDLSQQQKVVKQLRKYLDLDRSSTYPRDILTSKCAGWAVRSCESFFQEFVKRSGVDPGFITDERSYKS